MTGGFSTSLNAYQQCVENISPFLVKGKITKVIGMIIESSGPPASVGELCTIYKEDTYIGMLEVVGFREGETLLMALTPMEDIRPGMEVVATGRKFSIKSGPELMGRVLNGLGEPIDEKGPIRGGQRVELHQKPINPLHRKRISEPMSTGIRAIDGLKTVAKGQRMGIFAGSGVGKSVLMGMIARNGGADVNVVALIGERGREVKEFLEKDLGPEGLKRSIVVVATSDQPAVVRVNAAFAATAIAEFFRDQGKDVMFMMDSATRVALAQREIGLASGEPPTTRGYPPSVFSMLPKLFERTGMGKEGSITALYTVLVEGDDMDEPISDAVRSILDGHLVLSRDLANKNHYPAIDILASVSRCQNDVMTDEHKKIVPQILNSMATYKKSEDMIQLGAYTRGTNPKLDKAIKEQPLIEAYCIQGVDDRSGFGESLGKLPSLLQPVKERESK